MKKALLAAPILVAITFTLSIQGQEARDLIRNVRLAADAPAADIKAQKIAADSQSYAGSVKPVVSTVRAPLAVGTQLLQDSSFEAGPSPNQYGFATLSSAWGWYSSGLMGGTDPRYTSPSTNAAHTGSWCVYFDFGPSNDQLSQQITIPANSTATLSFWLKIGGISPNGLDTFGVNFTNLSGTAIQTFVKNYHYYTDYPGSYRYVYYSYDVSALAGQSVYLLFWTQMYGDTIFMLDDVSLTSTANAPPPSATCTEDAYIMCLGNGRYKVTSTWQNQYVGDTSRTSLKKTDLTDVVGAFWIDAGAYQFFVSVNPATSGLNGHAWVAINTFSGVEFWIDVTDTVSGLHKTYHNSPENKTLVEDRTFFVYP